MHQKTGQRPCHKRSVVQGFFQSPKWLYLLEVFVNPEAINGMAFAGANNGKTRAAVIARSLIDQDIRFSGGSGAFVARFARGKVIEIGNHHAKAIALSCRLHDKIIKSDRMSVGSQCLN